MSKQALAYKEKGNAAFREGNHALAIENYTYATELDPMNPIFFQNRATAYFKMDNFAKSLRDSEKALKLDPKSEKAHFRKNESLCELKRYDEAVAGYTLALQLNPDSALFTTGLAKAKSGLLDGKSQAEILKIDGNEAFKSGQIGNAVKIYTNAIACCDLTTEEGKSLAADIYANRAACNRQLYHSDEVVSDCTSALELKPNHTKALIRRGQAYEGLEKYPEALSDFETASRLGGGTLATSSASRIRKALKQQQKEYSSTGGY